MIKPKTKTQKQTDQTRLDHSAHKCARTLNTFIREFYDGEFRLDWIYASTINKMQDADNEYNYNKKMQEMEYTYTNWEEDKNHKEYDNATFIDKYK